MDANRKGYVYIRDSFAGIISETDDGYSFVYDDDYFESQNASSVSLTMPIEFKEYRSKTLFPFFDGLIPEGWLYETIIHNWKIDRNDRFGVLLVACKDCIGAVTVQGEKI